MDIGSTIKICRKAKGLSQSDLAELSDLSVSHLCLIEKNKREPTLKKLDAISNALNIPMSVLVFLAWQPSTIEELSNSQIEGLSASIFELMDIPYGQETLF